MFRSLALVCFAAAFSLSAALAQNVPAAEAANTKAKATPELLALFDEALQSLTQVEPSPRAGALFQMLGFAVHLDNSEPAKKVVTALMTLAPNIEPEELRNELYEGISRALFDMEEYAGAVEVLQRITQPAARYRSQLDLARKIVLGHEQDKTLKPFDAAPLIRQVISGAAETQDRHVTALAYFLLGRELARQGKSAESAETFSETIKIARDIEDLRDRVQIVQLVLQSQVLYGQIEGAQATTQAIDDTEIRRAMIGAFIQALIQHERYDEAERLIKLLPAEGAGRDLFVQRWVIANIKTVTDAKVGEFIALLSENHRERFLMAVVSHLQQISRGDAAVQVSRRLTDSAGAERALFTGKMEYLLEEKKFAEALQAIAASKEDEETRQNLRRQVLAMQFDTTREEALIQQILDTYTGEDKIAIEELREEAANAAQIADVEERMGILFEILQDQFRIIDLVGVRQTLKLLSEQLDKEADPVHIIDFRLLLARFQIVMRDYAGVKENLGKLMQMLGAVRDLRELKDLVPEHALPPADTGRIRVDLPGAGVASTGDESLVRAIRSQLFQIYTMMANLLKQAEAPLESKLAFDNARALANLEPDAMAKAEKLLMLAQLLAEGN